MKVTTIHLGNNKIELFNSSLGRETVKVDDEIVSSKYSMLGTDHEFTIMEDGKQVDCVVQFGYGMSGIVFDLYKDGQAIIESEKSSFMGYLMITAIIFVSVAVVLLIRLYNEF